MYNYDYIMSRIHPFKRKTHVHNHSNWVEKEKKHSNRIVHALGLLFPLGHIQKGNSQTVWIRKDIARLHANSRSHTHACMYHMDKYRLSNKKAGNNRPVNTRISPAEIFRKKHENSTDSHQIKKHSGKHYMYVKEECPTRHMLYMKFKILNKINIKSVLIVI